MSYGSKLSLYRIQMSSQSLLCSYGIPGQIFYSLRVPITAVMTVLENLAKVTTELQYMISSSSFCFNTYSNPLFGTTPFQVIYSRLPRALMSYYARLVWLPLTISSGIVISSRLRFGSASSYPRTPCKSSRTTSIAMWSSLLATWSCFAYSNAWRWPSPLPLPPSLAHATSGPIRWRVAYSLQLPPKGPIHDVFHVAKLSKYERVPPAAIMSIPAIPVAVWCLRCLGWCKLIWTPES